MTKTTTKRTKIEEIAVRHLDSFSPINEAGTKTFRAKNGMNYTTIKLAANGANDRAKKAIREAMLVEILAAKNALPGIVAELVGVTSATRHINVFTVETVDAREQMRGVCQVCGGLYAIEDGAVSLHGYKRPRWGFVVGRCGGSRHPAANVDTTLTESVMKSEAERAEKLAKSLDAAPAIETFDATRRIEKDEKGRGFWTSDRQNEQTRRYGIESAIRNARDYVTFATTNILPALGTAYTTVLK